EMRSPLSLISTLAQSAGTSSDVQVIQRQLATIQRIADRTLRAVSEVLYGHKSSEPGGSVPLARVVAALVRDHRQAGQRVDLGIQGTMPRISSGACALLEALLESLLANAFDHGDAALPVSVRLSITEGVLNISVSNAIADELDHSGLGV